MKIAVLGCGALGSYYGGRLCQAGHDVHFLLRSDYDVVRRDGVRIQSIDGDFHVCPKCARRAEEIGPAELVLIALKTTANAALAALLPPVVGLHTVVATLQNGLGNESFVASLVGAERTMGGLCFVCLNRVAPGRIHHLAHGAVVLGEFGRPPLPRTHHLAGLFQQAGIPCQVSENLDQAHWEKLVWNIPFNGLGVASCAGLEAVLTGKINPAGLRAACLTTDLLLADPRWAAVVRELMLEIIRAAQTLGLAVTDSVAERHLANTVKMGAYKPSTVLDFERGQELELESLFLTLLSIARRAGLGVPRLSALCEVLKGLAPGTGAK